MGSRGATLGAGSGKKAVPKNKDKPTEKAAQKATQAATKPKYKATKFQGKGMKWKKGWDKPLTDSQVENLMMKQQGSANPVAARLKAADMGKGYIHTGKAWVVNHWLRTGSMKTPLTDWHKWMKLPEVKQIVNRMDNATSKPLGTDAKLHRWVDTDAFKDAFGGSFDSAMKDMTAFRKKWKGATISDKGFCSASYDPKKNVFKNKPCHFEILASAKTKAFVSNNKEESEIVLPRNQKLRIFNVKSDGHGGMIIQAKPVD